tara:strand:- start:2475 stop:2927 length:453 start_codon:yes stop_codon:yes gene_type:complete
MKFRLLALLILIGFAACTNNKTEEAPEVITQKETVSDWARPAAKGTMSGAYLRYTNTLNTTDTLLSVSSDVAMMTQVHESYTTEDGLAGMREKKDASVAPGEELVLERGGLHVMLMRLNQDLVEGDSVKVTLTFKEAGRIDFNVPILSSN